jgi:hypothetical protein
MTPEINYLKAAYENALAVYQRAVSDSNLALQKYTRLGSIEDAQAYAAKAQIEGQRHAEYRDLAKRLRLALRRQQR